MGNQDHVANCNKNKPFVQNFLRIGNSLFEKDTPRDCCFHFNMVNRDLTPIQRRTIKR